MHLLFTLARKRPDEDAQSCIQEFKHDFEVSFKFCVMYQYGQCAIDLDGSADDPTCTEGIDWIACDHCGSWYHSVCVGLSATFCEQRTFFCSCKSITPEMDDM